MTVTNEQLKTLITNNATTTNANFKKAKKAIDGKVDKVDGKGLSTNDYTTAEKNKLGALPTNAELQAGYVAKVSGKGLSTEDYTTAEKTKLGALPTNAELQAGYVAKDGSKVLSDNNFTDALKTKLEGLENAPSVTMEQAETPDSGMVATYQLIVGGVATGAKINVAKDKVIGTPIIKTCEIANTPINGLAVGDRYVEFPIANSSEKQYLSVAELYNVYQQGNGIIFDGKQIKIDTSVVAQKSDLPDALSDLTDDLMTGYAKASSVSAVGGSDSVKVAIGKLEKAIDGKQASGSYANATHGHTVSEISDFAAATAGFQTAQDVTDAIDDIFGDVSITAWDDIDISE